MLGTPSVLQVHPAKDVQFQLYLFHKPDTDCQFVWAYGLSIRFFLNFLLKKYNLRFNLKLMVQAGIELVPSALLIEYSHQANGDYLLIT